MSAAALPEPQYIGPPLTHFSLASLGTSLLGGGVVLGILAVAAFVVVLLYRDRPHIAPLALQAMSCTGAVFLVGIVASWIGVMILV